MVSEDGSHFCVEKAVRQGHCEPLNIHTGMEKGGGGEGEGQDRVNVYLLRGLYSLGVSFMDDGDDVGHYQ